MSLVDTLKRTFLWSWVSPAQSTVQASPPVAPLVKLPRILLAHATRPGRPAPVSLYDMEAWCADDPSNMSLFVTAIGVDQLIFHTPSPVQVGESLEAEALLQGVGQWRGLARVDWVQDSGRGFTGQAYLTSPPDHQARLKIFVERQRKGMRG